MRELALSHTFKVSSVLSGNLLFIKWTVECAINSYNEFKTGEKAGQMERGNLRGIIAADTG